MKRLCSVACSLVCMVLLATAALAVTVTEVEVLEYGLYTYDEKVVMLEERQGATKLSNIRLLKKTLDIPVGEQTFFGIKYVLQSDDTPRQVDIELRVTNPEGETSTGSMKAMTGLPTITNIEFTNNDPAGVYLFQVLHGDRVLLSKEINVIKPQ